MTRPQIGNFATWLILEKKRGVDTRLFGLKNFLGSTGRFTEPRFRQENTVQTLEMARRSQF
jgi:hypothetical protein